MLRSSQPAHVVRRYGKAYQLRIENESDLERLEDFGIDHWVATAAPSSGFQCDPRFLELLDSDGNGRITSSEIIGANRWLLRVLKNRSCLFSPDLHIRLSDLNEESRRGQNLRKTVILLLPDTAVNSDTPITLDQVRARRAELMQSGINGDGVFPPAMIEDPDLKAYGAAVLDTIGGVPDLSGQPGIGEAQVNQFQSAVDAHLAWLAQGAIPEDTESTPAMPLGEATRAAYDAFAAIRTKVEEFFAQCRLIGIEPASQGTMRIPDARLKELQPGDIPEMEQMSAEAPLQPPQPEETLDLNGYINPVYAHQIVLLREAAIEPLFEGFDGKLTRSLWQDLKNRFVQHERWLIGKAGAAVEKLGEERLREYAAGTNRAAFSELLVKDAAVANEIAHYDELERLLLYRRYYVRLLNNFVNLAEVYNPAEPSLVNAGMLVLDGRRFAFSLRVRNRAAHKAIANRSGLFLMYLEITGKDVAEKFEIVCPVTRGKANTIFPGKRGVFFDVNGREWDAIVMEIVISPISIRQAIAAPFHRALEFVETKVEGLTTMREKQWETQLGTVTESAEGAMQQRVQQVGTERAPVAPVQTQSSARRDLLIGGGIAFAAIGSTWAFIARTFTTFGWMKIGIVLATSAAVVMIPTIIVAILKLRRRNLGSLFEGAEWAINMPLRMTRGMARLLTSDPKLPKGTKRERGDALSKFVRMRAAQFEITEVEDDTHHEPAHNEPEANTPR